MIREGEVKIRYAHGDTITYPQAHINISVRSLPDIAVKATVSKNLLAAVLLGRDVPELTTLLKHVQQAQPQQVLAVTTRAQTREQERRELTAEEETTHVHVASTRPQSQTQDKVEVGRLTHLDDSLFSTSRNKPPLTRAQKRRNMPSKQQPMRPLSDAVSTYLEKK